MKTRKNLLKAILGIAFVFGLQSNAQNAVKNEMNFKTANQNIVEFAAASKDHTTLVAALNAADLVETLSGTGPFTVFAPTNAAFAKIPKEALASLLLPENKEKLQAVLTYHVISGKFDSKAITEAIKIGSGTATFITAKGEKISGSFEGNKLVLTDKSGGKSVVTIADLNQSNGIIHVVDSVLMP